VSVVLTRNSSTWTANFDNVTYAGLPFRNANQTGFDLSKITFVNALREEVVASQIDNVMVVRTGTQVQPPTASFTYYTSGSAVYVDASSSFAQSGIATYTWNWGDGSPLTFMTTPYASHNYATGNATSAGIWSPSSGSEPYLPAPPYLVYGYVTNTNGTPMLGLNVMITNMNTGVSVNTTTDSVYGDYVYDITTMSGGFHYGDLIRVIAYNNGTLSGTNQSVAANNTAYLEIDVTVYQTGQLYYYPVTLTVTDNLGQSASTTVVIPIIV
jgi:hypothetical protein